MDQLVRGKLDLDVVGHYARPDVFQLTVDTRPRVPVSWSPVSATSPDSEGAESGGGPPAADAALVLPWEA